jgi:hypothetical protein
MICLVACGKKKRTYSCRARDMYIGSMFRARLAFAEMKQYTIYIISAKYGLLCLTDIISPYDKTMKNASQREQKAWAFKVITALDRVAKTERGSVITILGGAAYYKYLAKYYRMINPFAHLKQGEQIKKLKELLHEKK